METTLTVYYCLKLPLSLLRTAQNHPMVGTPFTMLWYYFARYTLFESFLFGRHLQIDGLLLTLITSVICENLSLAYKETS